MRGAVVGEADDVVAGVDEAAVIGGAEGGLEGGTAEVLERRKVLLGYEDFSNMSYNSVVSLLVS
jgi:hypothetical protein